MKSNKSVILLIFIFILILHIGNYTNSSVSTNNEEINNKINESLIGSFNITVPLIVDENETMTLENLSINIQTSSPDPIVLNENSSLMIINCIINDNRINLENTKIYLNPNSTLKFVNTKFTNQSKSNQMELRGDSKLIMHDTNISRNLIISGYGYNNGFELVECYWNKSIHLQDDPILHTENIENININIINSTIASPFNKITMRVNSTLNIQSSTLITESTQQNLIQSYKENTTIRINKSILYGNIDVYNGRNTSTLTVHNSNLGYNNDEVTFGIRGENLRLFELKNNNISMNVEKIIYGHKNFANIIENNTIKYQNYKDNIEDTFYNIELIDFYNRSIISKNSIDGATNGIRIVNFEKGFSIIEKNNLTNINFNAIEVDLTSNIEIKGNNLKNFKNGIISEYVHNINILQNNFSNKNNVWHSCNFQISSSEKIKISNNTLINSKFDVGTEYSLYDCDIIEISNNHFIAELNEFHARMGNCSNSTISGNKFENENIFFIGCENITVYLNQFLGTSDGYELDSTNLNWDNTTHGNYWEQFETIDDDNDNVSDIAYEGNTTIYEGVDWEGSNDTKPLTKVFFYGSNLPSYTTNTTITPSKTEDIINNKTYFSASLLTTILAVLIYRKKRNYQYEKTPYEV